MSSIHSLSTQKHRLSILFSLSIFIIIVVLDIGFLFFKYIDYIKQERGRLFIQSQSITKVLRDNPNIEQDILQGKGLLLPNIGRGGGTMNPDGSPRGMRRNIQMESFFLYNTQDNRILFSPQKDDELYISILQDIQSSYKQTFELGENTYFFLQSPISKNIHAIFFTESRMTLRTIVADILLYLSGAFLLSLGVYFISSRFVNITLSPVEKNMEQMEQFIHNAGHELKTPIAVIKSSLELMLLKKNYKEGVNESIEELNRMDGLIQALISLSTFENMNHTENIDVYKICEKLEKHYQENLNLKHISLEIIQKKPLHIQGNKEYTEILISNLISNAIKYNRENGNIKITIDEKSIIIEDSGIGIAPENIEKIFDRFYQEGEARDENSFGIGLSLVQKIVDIHHWTIAVESKKGIGTIIEIKF